MRAGRALRAGLGLGLGLGALLVLSGVAATACASLVGVEDVTLRRDAGRANDDAGEDKDPPAQEGDATDSGPPPSPNLLEVALGLHHTCARKPDRTVKCWGDDSRGQLGAGTASNGGVFATPQVVSAVTDAIAIASGQNHTCVVRASGKVSCWGDNQDGQLGNGQTNTRSPSPVDVTGVTDARAVACGASFSCALRASGGVACWGNGLGGQLGNGSKQMKPLAGAVSNLADAVAISAGESHACAVKAGGTLVCWGDGMSGQLGTGDRVERTTPTAVLSLDGIALVAAASRSTCAAKTTGAVFCWGANETGQLGSGAATPSPNPTPTVVSGLDAIAIWAGSNHACAVRRGGAVACWGAGLLGQIGDGQPRATAATPTPSPAAVSGVTNAIGVGTGGNHSCAPTSTGLILCWGENARGELGTGKAGTPELSPDSVVGYP
jgi:alpha-tubulin suppressor-like RCC1 family protein